MFRRRSRTPDPAPIAPPAGPEQLVEQGRLVEAIDLLGARNRRQPSPQDEAQLIELRRAAVDLLPATGPDEWPVAYADPFPDVVDRLPEVERAGLSATTLGGGIVHHGCLLVRGLLDEQQVRRTVESIERATAARSHGADGAAPGSDPNTDRWFAPFDLTGNLPSLRAMVGGQGGTWLADSPASTAQVLGDLEAAGALDAVAAYFGGRPLFSLQKSTLRRSEPINNYTAWHQDGAFLGPGTRALNIWVALSPCGGGLPTPSIELVPKRIAEILETDGQLTRSSVSDESVLRAAGETPLVCPEFQPGDAMMFDERFLHRTHLREGMTYARDALECWFFPPGHTAPNYVYLVA